MEDFSLWVSLNKWLNKLEQYDNVDISSNDVLMDQCASLPEDLIV